MINARHSVTPAEPLTASATWMPEGPGKWSRPLRFLPDNEGWVELMRLDPGVRLGLHRHTGEIHAYNLQGRRRLCTGEIVGPGDYVHEHIAGSRLVTLLASGHLPSLSDPDELAAVIRANLP